MPGIVIFQARNSYLIIQMMSFLKPGSYLLSQIKSFFMPENLFKPDEVISQNRIVIILTGCSDYIGHGHCAIPTYYLSKLSEWTETQGTVHIRESLSSCPLPIG